VAVVNAAVVIVVCPLTPMGGVLKLVVPSV
jgi:hypothetical protein